MTDLQVKLRAQVEQERANRVTESLKERDVASQESLRESQISLNRIKVDEAVAQIAKIQADTALTEVERKKAIQDIVNNAINIIPSITDPTGIKRSFSNGFGSGFGKALGTLLFK